MPTAAQVGGLPWPEPLAYQFPRGLQGPRRPGVSGDGPPSAAEGRPVRRGELEPPQSWPGRCGAPPALGGESCSGCSDRVCLVSTPSHNWDQSPRGGFCCTAPLMPAGVTETLTRVAQVL